MDFIKKLFVGVLAFLQGLLGGITKTLGIGKSEYFLELMDDITPDNEASSAPSASSNGVTPTKKKDSSASKPAPSGSSASGSSASAPSASAPSKAKSSNSARSDAAPSSGQPSSSQSASGSSSPKLPDRPSAPEPSLDTVTPPADPTRSIQSPAQPRTEKPAASTVVAPSSDSGNGSKPEKVGTFAPNFLLNRSTTGGRRRPGPSLNPFKDMARDMGGAR